MKPLLHWSYSMLALYRSCPFAVKLKYIERAPEPPPTPDREAANERGVRIHKGLEDAVMHGGPTPPEAAYFAENVEQLRGLRTNEHVHVEVEKRTYFDSNWSVTNASDYWLVVVRDAFVVTPEYALTIDYKTGKRYGNEVKHFSQMSLYAVCAWLEYPMYQEYPTELWYLDQKHLQPHDFSRTALMKHRAAFDAEVDVMLSDKFFRPRPSRPTCKFCPYSPRGTGACPVGV